VCLSSGEAEEGRDEAELSLDFTLADPFACPFLIMFTAS
jgi:hypothetical protein